MLLTTRRLTSGKKKQLNLKLSVFIFKKLNVFIKSGKSGGSLNHKGTKLIKARKKLSLREFIVLSFKPSYWTTPTLITNILFYTKIYKFVMLLKYNNGVTSFKLCVESAKLFSYQIFDYNQLTSYFKFLTAELFLGLCFKNTFISNLELFWMKGFQYARANGVSAKILFIDLANFKVLVQLPSQETKFFSIFSTCSLTKMYFSSYNLVIYGNSRYKRLKGFGPKVRGVAMNAVDHPHGGNTKSIKFPRTPWGKATKLK